MYERVIKNIFDFMFSSIVLILTSPLFILTALIIKITSRGPIFFKQNRVGLKGKTFNIVKFRTMLIFEESYKEDGSPMENYDRVTIIGKLLRKFSLDELPQLINILRGEMSLIGPRPTLSYQVKRYDDYQKTRLLVKPGLTGLAQVNGRNNISWSEKIEFDILYVKKISLLTDIKIFFKTFIVVLKGSKTNFNTHDDISKHNGDTLDDVK